MIRFTEKTESHCARLVGDDMEQLIEEAMKYVTKHRTFYEKSMREELRTDGSSHVSGFSSSLGGLFIYYDPDCVVDDDDFKNLSGYLFFQKYEKIKNPKKHAV